MKNLYLCCVDGPWAFFTEKSLDEQWGDDWDDAPYEHNAGDPYDYALKVAWEGPFEEPREGFLNSPYSVEQINRGFVAWLRPYSWIEGVLPIKAGSSLEEFVSIVTGAGGMVYFPVIGGEK